MGLDYYESGVFRRVPIKSIKHRFVKTHNYSNVDYFTFTYPLQNVALSRRYICVCTAHNKSGKDLIRSN